MIGADLLVGAANLSSEETNVMAHALGWPDLYHIRAQRSCGRIRWRNPYRNYYVCPVRSATWEYLRDIHFAEGPEPHDSYPDGGIWRVTAFGQRMLRLRLQAEIEAAREHR